jgi:uridine kinase
MLSLFTDAFDTEQLLECMGQLKRALPVNVPIYDFTNHRRCSERFRKVVIIVMPYELVGMKKVPVFTILSSAHLTFE